LPFGRSQSFKKEGDMKRRIFSLITLCIGVMVGVSPSLAFDMTKYWPVKAGTVWIFDRDHFIVGSKTNTFTYFTGTQLINGSSFCDTVCGTYFYFYGGSEGLLGVGLHFADQTIDLLDTPLKFASAEMSINDVVITTIPAGRIDDDQITFTVTLVGQETVTVPAGQFNNALVLQIRVDDSATTYYTEKLWLAEGIGPVKIQRVSESPLNHEGCLFSCGSFNFDSKTVVQREISLEFLLGPPLVDTNNDGRVGMEEAIYILQTMANIR
jgi:hypothetical protein